MPPIKDLNNYARLVLIIVNCGTLLTKKLFETRMKELFPNDTISDFLEKNKKEICDAEIGKRYKRILFPPMGHINIHTWDLTLFCFLLQLKMCNITGIYNSDIRRLKDMRNDIYHCTRASKSASEFKNDLKDIQVIFDRTCDLIQDEDFKKELNDMVENLKEENNLLEELVEQCREREKWFELMESLAEKQEQTLQGISEIQREQKCQSCQVNVLLVKLDTISSQLSPGQQVNQDNGLLQTIVSRIGRIESRLDTTSLHVLEYPESVIPAKMFEDVETKLDAAESSMSVQVQRMQEDYPIDRPIHPTEALERLQQKSGMSTTLWKMLGRMSNITELQSSTPHIMEDELRQACLYSKARYQRLYP